MNIGNLDLDYWDGSSVDRGEQPAPRMNDDLILSYLSQHGETSPIDISSHFSEFRERAVQDCMARLIDSRKVLITPNCNLILS